jgi:hypothetical protein
VNFGKEGFGGRFLEPPDTPVDETRIFTTAALSDPARLHLLDTYLTGDMTHASSSWAGALWPQNPAPVFALSAKAACLLDGAIYTRPANEPLTEGLKLILDPDVPIGSMALLMLCRGLNAIDKTAAAATIDAILAAIEDGRLDGESLGTVLHQFLNSGLVFPKRWPERVREIARSSPLARAVLRRAFERSLHPHRAQFDLRDAHTWLEILLDISVDMGLAIDDGAAREGIAARAASGKAIKVGRALLDLKGTGPHQSSAEIAMLALAGRTARAEKWLARKRGEGA